MSAIKNVAIAGASGSLGSVILEKLVASGKFNVRVLKRSGSSAKFSPGTEVVEVDFDSLDSVKSALAGQDAVVSAVTGSAIQAQKNLVDAAVATGVKRLIPSDFGSNIDNPKARVLPVYAQKIEAQEYIKEKSRTSSLTYTFVYNGAFFDWGLERDFLLNFTSRKATLVDGGDTPFSTTTLASVADGVIGVLTHLDETKNRTVFIQNAAITQKKLVELAQKAVPNEPWTVENVKLDDLTAAADARLAKGLFDMQTFVPYLFRAVFDPAYGGDFTGFTDNKLLGVKELSEDELLQIVKSIASA